MKKKNILRCITDSFHSIKLIKDEDAIAIMYLLEKFDKKQNQFEFDSNKKLILKQKNFNMILKNNKEFKIEKRKKKIDLNPEWANFFKKKIKILKINKKK
jgi:hypothetical protein